MFVYVLNQHGQPLMPCSPPKARHLLKQGKANVVRRDPFTIKLLHGSSGYKQEIVAGMDTGSKTIGSAAIGNGQVLYQAEVTLRDDISKTLTQRASFRRTRRSRKTRYRPARWQNRIRPEGWLAPSIRSKVDSHLREHHFVESIIPVTRWKVELAAFDIHKITSPDVAGAAYQNGAQKDFYNVKAYVLHRDGHTCQSGRKCKHSPKLEVHHIVFRSQGGTDTPSNLITLCEDCHAALHNGEFALKTRRSKTKHATEVGIVKSAIARAGWRFQPTFGYETKFKREQFLQLPKTHANDAIAIACEDGDLASPNDTLYRKRHVSKGDYQLTKGKRGETRIPVGKLFRLRKFDLIATPHGIGFVKGKRSTGYFSLGAIDGTVIHNSVNVRANIRRLAARSTTLTWKERRSSPP